MSQSPSVFIGMRYIRAKRRNGFISFVSLFAFLGVAIGVFALIVVLSVMNGFDNELKQRILRIIPHGYIEAIDGMDDWQALAESIKHAEGLVGSAPFIEGKGLISYSGNAKGVSILGIDTAREGAVSMVQDYMVSGSLADLEREGYNVILGRLVASYLDVLPGDRITLTLPEINVTPAGIFPRSRQFTVVGLFEVGAQMDQSLAMISLPKAQRLFRKRGRVDGLRLKFDNIYRSHEYLKAIEPSLDKSLMTKDWRQTQRSLFDAIKMEKTVVGFMLSIIIGIAAFNIVTTLIMMIAEKRGAIAVLRMMGMGKKDIVAIFMVQGLMLGLMGVLIGAAAGIAGAFALPSVMIWAERLIGLQLFDPSVYFVSHLPSLWSWQDTVWICLGSLAVSFLATIYPSYKASQIEPAEALRYDM